MSPITASLTVDVPVRAAYDPWTQFEESPQLVDRTEQVVQVDKARHRPAGAWRGTIGQAGSR
jgi:uncharacterized membrane protein